MQLIAALVDHSVTWMVGQAEDGRTRMEDPRVQAFLHVLLALTGFPGIGSVEETLSEVSQNTRQRQQLLRICSARAANACALL